MKLDESVFPTLQVGRGFQGAVNCLDFDNTGELLVASHTDDTLHLYGVDTGELKKTVACKQHGTSLVRFTHHRHAVIVASTTLEEEECIRYLSFHDLTYLRFFKGHRTRVCSMVMNPLSDTFISGSEDGEVRLWDLRTPTCQAVLSLDTPLAHVDYDPQGLIFAAVGGSGEVNVVDARFYQKGPFDVFTAASSHLAAQKCSATGITFSPDGKHALMPTDGGEVLLLNAFEDQVVQKYTGHMNMGQSSLQACFSADGQYILSGSEDGSIPVWHKGTGQLVHTLQGHAAHTPVSCVQWNPNKVMLASGGEEMAMWQPKPEAKTGKNNPFRKQGTRAFRSLAPSQSTTSTITSGKRKTAEGE